MAPPNIKLRGIRTPIPKGYILGRASGGTGQVELLDLQKSLRQMGIPTAAAVAGASVASAAKWTTARNFTYTGDVSGGPTAVDGSADVSFSITVNRAAKWTTARTFSWTGDVTGSGSVDGSGNVSFAMTGVQAAKWTTARTLSWTGDATGSMSVDGSGNASAALTLANSGVGAGTYGDASNYPIITVDAKGRVTVLTTQAAGGSAYYTTGAGTPAAVASKGTVYSDTTNALLYESLPVPSAKALIAGWNAQQSGGTQYSVSTASTTWFIHPSGGFGVDDISTTNEAYFQLKLPAAGTIRNLSALVLSNTRTTNTTIRTRVNGVGGNCIVTYGSGATGRQTDSTHSDTVAAGDLLSLAITTSTSTGTFTPIGWQIEYEAAGGVVKTLYCHNFNQAVSLSAAQVDVFPVEGVARRTIWGSPTDDWRKSRCYVGAAGTISNLRVYAVAKTMDINPTVEVYKNGVATGVTVTLTGTGAFEDTTHSIAVAVGDYLQFKTTTTGRTSGSLTLAKVQMAFTSNGSAFTMFGGPRQDLDPTNIGFASGTNYSAQTVGRFASTTEANNELLATFAFTASRLQTGWINNSGGNETLTLRKTGVDTAVTITMAAGITAATNTVDAVNTASFAINDTMTTKAVTGSATSGPYYGSITIDGATVAGWRRLLTADLNLSDLTNAATARTNLGLTATRELLTAARTYYVRTDGSDSNTGLVDSAGGAWLTLQHAYNVISTLDFGGNTVTLNVANGTYNVGIHFNNPWVGGGTLNIVGNTTTPANCVIAVTSDHCFYVPTPIVGTLTASGFKCSAATAGSAIYLGASCSFKFGAIEFGACPAGSHIFLQGSGINVACTANYTISGGAQYHINANNEPFAQIAGFTVTITGTPAFSSAFVGVQACTVNMYSNTYSGSATGSRYAVIQNGVLYTAAATLPGNAAGSFASGGQYL